MEILRWQEYNTLIVVSCSGVIFMKSLFVCVIDNILQTYKVKLNQQKAHRDVGVLVQNIKCFIEPILTHSINSNIIVHNFRSYLREYTTMIKIKTLIILEE